MHSKGSAGSPWAMSRRDFLKLGGLGIVGVAMLGSIGAARGSAQAPLDSSLAAEFEEAAKKYGVPVSLLLAIGYVNTRWEMPPPEASAYAPGNPHGRGAYGIMQLVQNDAADTLGEASKLTSISEEELRTNRKANILGGAALLAEAQGERPGRLDDYFGAVSGNGGRGKHHRAVAGVGAGELYAAQVFAALRSGAVGTIFDGEQITLPPQEGEL